MSVSSGLDLSYPARGMELLVGGGAPPSEQPLDDGGLQQGHVPATTMADLPLEKDSTSCLATGWMSTA